jgi:hypothetical protein
MEARRTFGASSHHRQQKRLRRNIAFHYYWTVSIENRADALRAFAPGGNVALPMSKAIIPLGVGLAWFRTNVPLETHIVTLPAANSAAAVK